MKKTSCVIVGLGLIGRELVRRLSRELDIVAIEKEAATAEEVRQHGGGRIRTVVGDATSRLVLEDAGVAEADAVVITFTTERLTLEVARLLTEHFQVPRILAVGITPSGTAALRERGVEAEGIFTLSAGALRNRIEQRARSAHGIGLGKEEILEVEVHPRSRLANKPLRDLAPQRWHVAMVYRDGNLVVPRGETVLRGRDRVVLTGDPGVLRTVTDLLSFNFRLFPLEYGPGLTAYLTGREDATFFEEFAYLNEVFPVEHTTFLLAPQARERQKQLEQVWSSVGGLPAVEVVHSDRRPLDAILDVAADRETRPGLLALARDWAVGSTVESGRKKGFLQSLTERAACPVLLAAGSFPYRDVAVPGVPGVDLEHVLESVLEMTESLGQMSHVLLVRPSEHLIDEHEKALFEANTATVSDMALGYRTKVESVLLQGNPVTAVNDAVRSYNLLVLDTGGWKRQTWLGAAFDPDVPWHLVRRCPLSMLLVPPEEEAL